MDCSPLGSSTHRIFQAWIQAKIQPFPSPGESSWPRDQPQSPALQADSLPTNIPGKPGEVNVRKRWSLFSRIQLFVTPWTAAHQASLSFTISQSLLKFMSIESVMPSNHLILCHPLFLLPSIFPSIRVFSSESALCIRWPKDWSFSFSISTSSEYSGLTSIGLTGLISLLSRWLSRNI